MSTMNIQKLIQDIKRKIALMYVRDMFRKQGYIPNLTNEQIEEGIKCLAMLVTSSKASFTDVARSLHTYIPTNTKMVEDLIDGAAARVEKKVPGVSTILKKFYKNNG